MEENGAKLETMGKIDSQEEEKLKEKLSKMQKYNDQLNTKNQEQKLEIQILKKKNLELENIYQANKQQNQDLKNKLKK